MRGGNAKSELPRATGLADGQGGTGSLDPWALVWGQPYINDEVLARAIADDLLRTPTPDYRSRLLVRDAARAIRSFWGVKRFARWLAANPAGERIEAILHEDLGEPGFRFIRRRLVAGIGKDQLEQVFDLLGRRVHQRIEVHVAGSIPTLLSGLTYRPTDDIDFVNEVPAEIRKQRAIVHQIKAKFGLTLGHVQSHYLPAGWEKRRQFLGDYGGIRVYLVDVYDVFVSKLSSGKEKHQDDLRVMAPKLDKETVRLRLLEDGKVFLDSERDRAKIEENWKFIYREPLFPESAPAGDVVEKPAARRKKSPEKKGRRKKSD